MTAPEPDDLPPPPGSLAPARRARLAFQRPIASFLALESASGILLVVAAALALAWANSPWRASYTALWHAPIGLRVGAFAFERDLAFWIDDGLMAVFFFVVGLEVRRELHDGALADARRAALPLAAALGGMVLPALVYLALNGARATHRGWGIPMATDIAFALGVLTLLGPRVPPALRVLLLALAVIDDVGAILVIALFYSSGIQAAGMGVLALGVAGVLVLRWSGVRSPWAYLAPALLVWAGAYAGGVHPTLAGVVLGLLTPVTAWFGVERAARTVAGQAGALHRARGAHELHASLAELARARAETLSPAERLQHALHGWVLFAILPLFALANAGVPLGSASFGGDGLAVFAGVALGLVLGKLGGILVFAWLAVRLGLGALPSGVRWSGVALVGLLGGIGFTMALFVAALALPAGAMLETAKLAILAGSLAAAVAALVVGRVALAPSDARDAGDVERSPAS